MNQDPSDKILNNMVAFIEQHGREEVERIKKSIS
jgi:vacuolar-type H+-ATPase subunit E/Vma4